MNVTIKTISYSNSSDRKIIQACLQNWFKNPKDLHLTSPQMTYPFDFRKWCALYYMGDDTTTFVALDKKWIAAYVSVKAIPENNRGILFHLIVDREYRRKGLAKLLMDHAEKYADKLKLKNLTLHVSPKNDRAINIYKKFGFVDHGTTSRGSIKMKKDL